jgi:ABC-2 type transport system permease protein
MLSEIFSGGGNAQPSGLVIEDDGLSGQTAPGTFVMFGNEAAALAAYEAGEIGNYYVVPAGFQEGAAIRHVAPSRTYPGMFSEQAALYQVVASVLTGDPALVQRLQQPAQIQETNLSPETGGIGTSGELGQLFVGIGIAMLFFATTLGAAGYLLQSLGKEKQSRVLEVLLSALQPRDLLVGKIIGLGAMGIVQLAVWSVVVILVLGRGDTLFSNLPLPALPWQRWALIALFYIAGYFVYATLYAGLGALSPNPKEGSQYAFLIILPVLIPLWFSNVFWTAPNSPAAVGMSLFPLTAPLAMPLRLSAGIVPAWQLGVSLALIIVTSIVVIALVTRLFRGQVLVSGQPLSLGYIWRTLWSSSDEGAAGARGS